MVTRISKALVTGGPLDRQVYAATPESCSFGRLTAE
jgi:hypothetical protein